MGDFIGAFVGVFFVVSVIGVIVALIAREMVCWYFKINESLSHFEEMSSTLKHLNNNISSLQQILEGLVKSSVASKVGGDSDCGLTKTEEFNGKPIVGYCSNCAKTVPKDATECPHCKALFGPDSAYGVI